jgi:hypothetical protein
MAKAPEQARSVTRAGALIEAARVRAGLTQRDLARSAGTSQTAISSYETGRKVPSLRTLERILASAGFELRTTLAPIDDHDESLARYVATLPKHQRDRFEEQQHRRRSTVS